LIIINQLVIKILLVAGEFGRSDAISRRFFFRAVAFFCVARFFRPPADSFAFGCRRPPPSAAAAGRPLFGWSSLSAILDLDEQRFEFKFAEDRDDLVQSKIGESGFGQIEFDRRLQVNGRQLPAKIGVIFTVSSSSKTRSLIFLFFFRPRHRRRPKS